MHRVPCGGTAPGLVDEQGGGDAASCPDPVTVVVLAGRAALKATAGLLDRAEWAQLLLWRAKVLSDRA